MHWFSIFISSSSPGVVPQTPPVPLLLKTTDVWHSATFSLELGSPAQERHTRGTCPNDANLLVRHCSEIFTFMKCFYSLRSRTSDTRLWYRFLILHNTPASSDVWLKVKENAEWYLLVTFQARTRWLRCWRWNRFHEYLKRQLGMSCDS